MDHTRAYILWWNRRMRMEKAMGDRFVDMTAMCLCRRHCAGIIGTRHRHLLSALLDGFRQLCMGLPKSHQWRIHRLLYWKTPGRVLKRRRSNRKSSLRRLLEPLTTIFPSQRSQPRPAAPGPRHSAPQLHTDSDGSNPIQSLPHTPRHQNQYAPNNLHPQTPHTDGAHSHRTSLATIYPGAFTSPLSSSLSAIVADSLRRGPNFSRLRSRRTGRPRLPNMPDSHTGRQRGNSDTTDAGIHAVDVENAIRAQYGESPSALRHTRSHDIHISDSASSTTAGSGRRRSLSTRIGDFLHLNRSKPIGH